MGQVDQLRRKLLSEFPSLPPEDVEQMVALIMGMDEANGFGADVLDWLPPEPPEPPDYDPARYADAPPIPLRRPPPATISDQDLQDLIRFAPRSPRDAGREISQAHASVNQVVANPGVMPAPAPYSTIDEAGNVIPGQKPYGK